MELKNNLVRVMQKVKKNIQKIEPKKIVTRDEEEKEIDPDAVVAEEGAEEETDEEEMLEDDVDPFHDKWEE
jgi:hypothetical protein